MSASDSGKTLPQVYATTSLVQPGLTIEQVVHRQHQADTSAITCTRCHVTRRGLIIAGGALLLLSPASSILHRDSATALPMALLHAARHVPDAHRIGQAIIATEPDFLSDTALNNPIQDASVSLIDERIRQDYRDSQTLTVKGWVISKTEAIICVLIASQPSPVSHRGHMA